MDIPRKSPILRFKILITLPYNVTYTEVDGEQGTLPPYFEVTFC